MSTSAPMEEWLFEDFIEDMRQTAESGMYYEIAPKYAKLFLRRIDERMDMLARSNQE